MYSLPHVGAFDGLLPPMAHTCYTGAQMVRGEGQSCCRVAVLGTGRLGLYVFVLHLRDLIELAAATRSYRKSF